LPFIAPPVHKAKEKNEDFFLSYAKKINQFTMEFSNRFCDKKGKILWSKLVSFNARAEQPTID